MPEPDLSVAVLLSAGLSTRMGRPKALLDWFGVPLVVAQVHELRAAGTADVVVVTGHAAEEIEVALLGTGARIVRNPDYLNGRATSIRAGAAAVSTAATAIVLLNVDQPRHATVIRRVLEHHLAMGATITVPSCNGKRGHPAVLSGSLRDELLAVTEDEHGLRAVMIRHASERQELAFDTDEVLLDLNTPDAYERAIKQWNVVPYEGPGHQVGKSRT